eukprot:EG_transcript_18215
MRRLCLLRLQQCLRPGANPCHPSGPPALIRRFLSSVEPPPASGQRSDSPAPVQRDEAVVRPGPPPQSAECPHSQEVAGRWVYVTNLHPRTPWWVLKDRMKVAGDVVTADLRTMAGQRFGVVTYASAEEAATALARLEGTRLLGRRLHLQQSPPAAVLRMATGSVVGADKESGEEPKKHIPPTAKADSADAQGTAQRQILIKNLSFRTTQQALERHMKRAGVVDEVRVWLENGQNRGTVTYSSTQEAIRALQTLPSIPLDGRHLRLRQGSAADGQPRPPRN